MRDQLVLFDNDGTLCDTQEAEGRCYARAILEVTGRTLAAVDWATFPEPTSTAIIGEILKDDPDWHLRLPAIESRFVDLLREERPKSPGDFVEIPGAAAFITALTREPGIRVGIATGSFALEAHFKLACCGIELDDHPHATSSDTPVRREIIALAAARAGVPLASTIYFGDGPWDVASTRALGIPMIGIGRKIARLRELGVAHTFRDYADSGAIRAAMAQIRPRI